MRLRKLGVSIVLAGTAAIAPAAIAVSPAHAATNTTTSAATPLAPLAARWHYVATYDNEYECVGAGLQLIAQSFGKIKDTKCTQSGSDWKLYALY